MANKRPIGDHSDEKFGDGFSRYCIASLIIESKSWDDLIVKLKEINLKTNYQNLLYQEFKFYNCILIVEQKLCNLLEKLDLAKNPKEIKGIKTYLTEKLKRYRAIKNIEDAKAILDKEAENDDSDLLVPHILFYVCGLSLGDLIYLMREMTDDFVGRKKILDKLQEFNDYRTDIIHNLLSSRINIKNQIENGIELGIELEKLLDLKN